MSERDEEGKLNGLKMSIILTLLLDLPPSAVQLLDPLCLSFPNCKIGIIIGPKLQVVRYNGLPFGKRLEHSLARKCSLRVPICINILAYM